MKPAPETPILEDSDTFTGHLWIQERPTGGQFRFQVAASGLITFGTPNGTFDSVGMVPAPFRRAAETVSERLDRDAFYAATDRPDEVTFVGLATRNEGATYDWDTLPAFVGVDVWSGAAGDYLSPDAATSVYDRLGLPTLPAIQKEVPAAHATLSRYEDDAAFPPSQWRSGAAAGLLIRDKADGRAQVWQSTFKNSTPDRKTKTATELAATYVTDERIERTAQTLRDVDQSPTVDAVRDRLVADVARESYATLFADGEFVASLPEFESAIAERVQQHSAATE